MPGSRDKYDGKAVAWSLVAVVVVVVIAAFAVPGPAVLLIAVVGGVSLRASVKPLAARLRSRGDRPE